MSELINARANHGDLRWSLLATVSTLALLGFVYRDEARAADGDADRPTVWIELGGQLERVDGGEERFVPPFSAGIAQLGFVTPLSAERPARFANGGEGKISFEPSDSSWSLSVAIRYGRSESQKHLHSEAPSIVHEFQFAGEQKYQTAKSVNFADTVVKNDETHNILDFQAGKDVGLGLFGLPGNSRISAGVRFAQFTSRSFSDVRSDQNVKFINPIVFENNTLYDGEQYNAYHGTLQTRRSFSGVGPSISWDSSVTITGSSQESGIALDWGLNAAILFGRQKAAIRESLGTQLKSGGIQTGQSDYPHVVTSTQHSGNPVRSRFMTVPNIGGFAGLSFRYAAAKVSLGYRGDFFFGAQDGGLDAAKKESRGFYGPFATVSVGIGG